MDRTIAREDHMLTGAEDAYFRTAESGLEAVLAGLGAAGRAVADVTRILDFGSGYGRVYRALAAGFPHAELTACDLMEPAARFCAETFGGTWVKSNEDLSLVRLPHRYDLIWLGSVFTHLPASRWRVLLNFLADASEPGGVVVFTSHGTTAIRVLEDHTMKRNADLIPQGKFARMKARLPQSGFGFVSNQPETLTKIRAAGIDVTEGEYGFSFAIEPWVRGLVAALPEWRCVAYIRGGWGNNHDTVTLQRL